jgi:hypothetical protein
MVSDSDSFFTPAFASAFASTIPVFNQIPRIANNKQPTTIRDDTFVLGYTFQAYSCAPQIAYINVGSYPPFHNRYGVAQANQL